METIALVFNTYFILESFFDKVHLFKRSLVFCFSFNPWNFYAYVKLAKQVSLNTYFLC